MNHALSISKKILIAIYMPSLGGGGAERVMITLANGFSQRGYLVDLVVVNAIGPYLKEVSPDVNLVNLGGLRVITSLKDLIRYLRVRKPTVVLSAMGYANVIVLLAKKLAKCNTRIVVSERIDVLVEAKNNWGVRPLLIRLLNRYLYRSADVIHAVSFGVAKASASQLGLPLEKIKVVYNPVFSDSLLEQSLHNINFPWLINDGTPLILAVGRLTKQKDFTTLIHAFALLRCKSDALLVILGEGDMRLELEKLIAKYSLQNSVLLPGFVDNPFSVMSQASLFVLSSAWEGLPNVLIQAMACGVPVVATNCPSGPAEILENGKWGRLVPVSDAKSLSQAMMDTLEEPEHPNVVSRAAYFSIDRAVDGYLRLLLPELK